MAARGRPFVKHKAKRLALAIMATSCVFAPISPFAAELSTSLDSGLVSSTRLHPDQVSPVSDDFRRRVNVAVATIPEPIWRELHNAGWRLQIAEFVIDAAPTLMGERPRGWPTGMTWENTDAVNIPQRQMVVIAEKRRNRQGEVVIAERIEGVLRHEIGHAFDRIAGGNLRFQSSHPAFVNAYERDLHEIAKEQGAKLGYYLQGDAAGRQEAYAEAFAIVLGGGSDPNKQDDFLNAFPRVIAFVEQSMTARQTAMQTAAE